MWQLLESQVLPPCARALICTALVSNLISLIRHYSTPEANLGTPAIWVAAGPAAQWLLFMCFLLTVASPLAMLLQHPPVQDSSHLAQVYQ